MTSCFCLPLHAPFSVRSIAVALVVRCGGTRLKAAPSPGACTPRRPAAQRAPTRVNPQLRLQSFAYRLPFRLRLRPARAMAEAAPAAPYGERLKRALDALVYAPPSGADAAAANAAVDEVLRADDADATQVRYKARALPCCRRASCARCSFACLRSPCGTPTLLVTRPRAPHQIQDPAPYC